MEEEKKKGIDWSKNNVYEAVGRPDLKPKKQTEEKCKECSTYRKVANNGARYLCNHFSEHCVSCERWAKSGCCTGDGFHFEDCPQNPLKDFKSK